QTAIEVELIYDARELVSEFRYGRFLASNLRNVLHDDISVDRDISSRYFTRAVALFDDEGGNMGEQSDQRNYCNYCQRFSRHPVHYFNTTPVSIYEFFNRNNSRPECCTTSINHRSGTLYGRLVEIALKEVDKGVVEAAIAMGAKTRTIIFRVLLPESMPALVSGLTVTAIALIGYTAMAGVIGAGG